jgi:acetyl esterase/lipase
VKRLIPLCVPLLLCLPSMVQADEEAPKILADQIYGRKDGMALTLDVIKPAKPNGAGVIWVQSGGWYSNWIDPKFLALVSKPYLDKGFTMFIVRHGSAPKYTVPEAAEDIKRSVRFIHMKAKDFGVDENRLGIMGGSAGGHLSLMIGTTGDDGIKDAKDDVLKHSSRVAAVVALYPPTDISDWVDNPPEEIKKHPGLKPPLTFDKKKAPEYSPLLKVTSKAAPTLLIHGDKDLLVPIEHSTKMIKALEKAKVTCKLVTIEGAAHGFNKEQNEKTVAPEMIGWFEKHLAKKKE